MDYDAYQRAINQGFSEREASRIGEEAWECREIDPRYEEEMPDPDPGPYLCDVCGKHPAVTGLDGVGGVCSQECHDIGVQKRNKETTDDE